MNTKLIFLFCLFFTAQNLNAQNYVKTADSCFRVENYQCAGEQYDLFLEKVEGKSNMIAYRSARAWAKAGQPNKAFTALNRYADNNFLLGNDFFSMQLKEDSSFVKLHDQPKWKELLKSITVREKKIAKENQRQIQQINKNQQRFEHRLDIIKTVNKLPENDQMYDEIKHLDAFASPKAFLEDRTINLIMQVDGKEVPYQVIVPENYNPALPVQALVVLKGNVHQADVFLPINKIKHLMLATSKHLPKYSQEYLTIVPSASSSINWMDTETGFDMVNKIVIQLKRYFNIDDNRIHLIGHSNGATGVFSYLLLTPSLYAGFYGLNTRPRVELGGTYLLNAKSRHFYNFATDKDYYYPPQAVRTIDSLARELGVDWHTQLNEGYPHWFPIMEESAVPMATLFQDMANRQRNPYPKNIYFETDNVKYGISDWISIDKLDTLGREVDWKLRPNFWITDWIDNKDFNKHYQKREQAFKYPRKSGAVKSSCNGNDIDVQVCDVKELSVFLNREMVDYTKPVKITINGKMVFNSVVQPDYKFTKDHFKTTFDRKAIWENKLSFTID